MNRNLPRGILEVLYEDAAQTYLRGLPLEHFMEATAQATQRKITLESLDLVSADRPDVHVFNELLVQYPLRRPRDGRDFGQIVPDNMVVLSEEEIGADTSFNVPLEPAPPFWVMEYVSKNNKRKDYGKSFKKYERDLKVPYYLISYPDTQDLSLYRHNRRSYVTVKPTEDGRYAVPELDIEIALLDGWVRYWCKGKLLPSPKDLQREVRELRRQIEQTPRRVHGEQCRADEEQRRAEEFKQARDRERARAESAENELAQLRLQLEQLKARPRKGK